MEEKYYTHEFDTILNKIDIYNRYPFLPFIGSKYSISNIKILCLGESHFLPKVVTDRLVIDDSWYQKELSTFELDAEAIRWLSTRVIINEDVIKNLKQNNSHSIYINIGKEIAYFLNLESFKEALKTICFYNYFLRPAENEGKSIKNTKKDNEFAFNHLVTINQILKPDAIIFTSKKARHAFHRRRWNYEENKEIGGSLEKIIYDVPHPGCVWWNRKSKSYAIDGSGPLTGKEKFDEIIKKLIKEHSTK